MKASLTSIISSSLALSLIPAYAGVDAIFMRDSYYNYEVVNEIKLRGMQRDDLLEIRSGAIASLERYQNILQMTEGSSFHYEEPTLNKLVFSNEDIIEDILLSTKVSNQLLYRLNKVIEKKLSIKSKDQRVNILIEGGHIANRGRQCNFGTHQLSFGAGELAVVRLYCNLKDYGMVETYATISMDLSYRVHVNNSSHTLPSKDPAPIKGQSRLLTPYHGTIAETILNYSIHLPTSNHSLAQ